jgi:hypothetical protein
MPIEILNVSVVSAIVPKIVGGPRGERNEIVLLTRRAV